MDRGVAGASLGDVPLDIRSEIQGTGWRAPTTLLHTPPHQRGRRPVTHRRGHVERCGGWRWLQVRGCVREILQAPLWYDAGRVPRLRRRMPSSGVTIIGQRTTCPGSCGRFDWRPLPSCAAIAFWTDCNRIRSLEQLGVAKVNRRNTVAVERGRREARSVADFIRDRRPVNVFPIWRACFGLRSDRTGSVWQPLAC